jgi:tRNA threonylcarbamoyl adenosine modification protein YjeE
MKTNIIFSQTELSSMAEVARQICGIITQQNLSLILLNGNLGSGKTHLTRCIIHHLAQDSNIIVDSPTFSIVNTYNIVNFGNISHFDLYRIKDYHELIEIDIDNTINSSTLSLIEWHIVAIPIIQHIKCLSVNIASDNSLYRNIEVNY